MLDQVRARAVRLLRIPPDPQVPEGEERRVRVFRAAPRFYHYCVARWVLAQLGALAGLIGGVIFLRMLPRNLESELLLGILLGIEALAWLAFLAQLPFTFAMVHLDFSLRWYIVSDRSLRIREGLTRIREQTMTFANIQNMAIRQGPLQRLLGIADLEVHTAGGGAKSGSDGSGSQQSGRPMHVAVFRGVDNATEIRDAIRDRVRRHRDAGLGDPDDVPVVGDELGAAEGVAPALPALPALGAARELLEEMRRLRGSLALERPVG
jgi:membrane protein YdbS with pleckstrin-like domain